MASPWKFLSRLVSPRREQKQDADTVDAAKPDRSVIDRPIGTVAEESLASADLPAAVEPPHQDPTDAVAAETAPVNEAESKVDATEASVGAEVAVGDTASSAAPQQL